MANEKFAMGLTQIQNAVDSADAKTVSNANSNEGDFAIVGDQKRSVKQIEQPLADKIFLLGWIIFSTFNHPR